MSLHIRLTGTTNFCGRPGLVGLTLRFVVNHVEWAAVLTKMFGCRQCVEDLQELVENMHADGAHLEWPK